MIANVLKGHGAFIFRVKHSSWTVQPEDEGTVILWSIRNNWPEDTLSYCKRLESTVPPVWEPQIL